MNILFLVNTLDHGGAERVAAMLASEWVAMGHRVTVMPTFHGASLESVFPIDERLEVRPLTDPRERRRNWLRKVVRLRREIVGGRYDVICGFLMNVNVLALAASLGTAVPVVVSERTFPPRSPDPKSLRILRRLLYPRASRVVMQTEEGLRWLETAIPSAKGTVLSNPIRLPLRDNPPIRTIEPAVAVTRKLLLAVGRFSPEKRFPWLVEAFGSVAADFPGWDLAILGDGTERGAVQHAADISGLAGRVHLPGMTGNLDAWYRRADAFALVSAFEGFPNALAEAVGYGIKSLAIDCATGPSELVHDGENGVLLPRDATADDLRGGLRLLLAGDFAVAGVSARVATDYSLAGIAQKWIDLFGKVMAEKGA